MIYLDNNATTRLDANALAAMLPFMTELYANASATHLQGMIVGERVAEARENTARMLGAKPTEMVFTSGATEGLNLVFKNLPRLTQKRRIITFQTEHKAVLEPCLSLQKQGFEVIVLPVESDGQINQNLFLETLTNQTALVAAMLVNNETGVIHNVQAMAIEAQAAGALFLTDATQAVGKINVDFKALGVDFLVFSAHKFHGPKGIGGLLVGKDVGISAEILGGGQERNRRSGTLNVPGIIGQEGALQEALQQLNASVQHIEKLRNLLEVNLLKIDKAKLNGSRANRLYNVSNICFEGHDADAMMRAMNDVMVSNGSACTAASIEPSHVLMAMTLSEEQAFASLRFSLSKYTTEAEIMTVVERMKSVVMG